jgi:CRP/FNR family cyclic AMP-dependent transcriptional regulator
MNGLDTANLLRQIPILAALPENEKVSLLKCLTTREVRSGKFLMRSGVQGGELIFIAEGQVKVCKANKEGDEIILAILGPGQFVGEILILTGSDHVTDVVALLPCKLLVLQSADFHTHLAKYPGLAAEMLKLMADRVRVATGRITDLALYDVCCRVARTLFQMGTSSERNGKPIMLVNPRPPHQMLASMVGSSRETVSRALKTLEEEGHILVDEDCVYVKSIPG